MRIALWLLTQPSRRCDLVRLLGHQVRTANDGVQAVEAFRPEVILRGIGILRLNGLEPTRRTREQPRGKAITIIALTG